MLSSLFPHRKFIRLDGGMGSMLQKGGMPVGALPEVYNITCLLYTSPSPRDRSVSRMPSSA